MERGEDEKRSERGSIGMPPVGIPGMARGFGTRARHQLLNGRVAGGRGGALFCDLSVRVSAG